MDKHIYIIFTIIAKFREMKNLILRSENNN